jgi:tRNA threonylcarbamoyladenosine biosynthesis protein TsaB
VTFPYPAKILAVDTTGPSGSIALVGDSCVIEEVPMESPSGFAHVVFGEIEALLRRHQISIGEIDGFASASGPGSFTGVRIGLTAVKGLAEATGKPAIAISNLKVLASYGTRDYRATLIDARRGEIYGAVYNSSLELAQDEVVIQLTDWLTGIQKAFPADNLEFITQGGPLRIPLPDSSTFAPIVPQRIVQAPQSLAGAIGQIALGNFRLGLGRNPVEIDANYVRRSDAELLWREPGTR